MLLAAISIRELIALTSLVVAAVSLAIGFWNARKTQVMNVALQLSAEMKGKWNSGWSEALERLEQHEAPLSESDVKLVREMLNWVNWVGAFYNAGLIPNPKVILGRGNLGPAMRRILTVGRPVIQGDVSRHGVSYWEELGPLCRFLRADDIGKLLSLDHRVLHASHLADPGENSSSAGGDQSTVDRLKPHWPEPIEQMHTGGWRSTDWLIHRLGISSEAKVLDVCCGEGATAVWITRLTGADVCGVDHEPAVVEAARKLALVAGQRERCRFAVSDLHALPYEEGEFSIIIGQDPDGLATPDIEAKFAELYRVLEPGGVIGFHHWVAAPGAAEVTLAKFKELNERLGASEYGATTADTYLAAMARAGFLNIYVQPLAELYETHMQAVFNRTMSAVGPTDRWSEGWLDAATGESAHPCGVAIFANKPSAD